MTIIHEIQLLELNLLDFPLPLCFFFIADKLSTASYQSKAGSFSLSRIFRISFDTRNWSAFKATPPHQKKRGDYKSFDYLSSWLIEKLKGNCITPTTCNNKEARLNQIDRYFGARISWQSDEKRERISWKFSDHDQMWTVEIYLTSKLSSFLCVFDTL